MRRTKRSFAALAIPLLLVAAWAGRVGGPLAMSAEQGESVTPGTWGGEGVRMEVTEDGAGLDFVCAHSRIEHKLTTAGGGRFSAKGTYVSERGGPEREEEEKGVPALYSGRTDGKTMTLTVKLTGTNEELGPFTLAHGRKVRLTKCK
jgi:hypothetical protein